MGSRVFKGSGKVRGTASAAASNTTNLGGVGASRSFVLVVATLTVLVHLALFFVLSVSRASRAGISSGVSVLQYPPSALNEELVDERIRVSGTPGKVRGLARSPAVGSSSSNNVGGRAAQGGGGTGSGVGVADASTLALGLGGGDSGFGGVLSRMSSGQKIVSSTDIDWRQVRASCAPRKNGGKVVLVTGTGGFIGSGVAKELALRGDGVLGIDNFNDYYCPSLKVARAKALREETGAVTVAGDINDIELMQRLFEECSFTHVVALAAQAGVRYATKNPDSYVSSNVGGLVSLLEVVRTQESPPYVVYASSSSVYGTNTKVPFSEEDAVNNPASLYAATKRSDELIAHAYNHIYKLKLTGLRYFTVYGPWGRPDMAVWMFTRNILKGEPITVYEGPGGVNLGRDFTYVDDIVSGTVGALDSAEERANAGRTLEVYNLGNKSPVAVMDMINMLERLLGEPAEKEMKPISDGDVLFTHANVTKASFDFGYTPSTPLEEGLRKFVDWYRTTFKSELAHECPDL